MPKHTNAVINVCGQSFLNPQWFWSERLRYQVWSSRVMPNRWLRDAIERLTIPPKVFVTISGVGYYAPNETAEYTEESPGGEGDFFAELCRDWEDASKLHSSVKCRRVIIRSGVVLGPNGGMIPKLRFPFMFGLGGPMGSGKQYMPWIHIQDLVNMFLFSIEDENVSGVLNGVAPEIITNAQFSKAYARNAFTIRRPSFFRIPRPAVDLIFSKERAAILCEGQKVHPRRPLELGFTYLYPDINSACKKLGYMDF